MFAALFAASSTLEYSIQAILLANSPGDSVAELVMGATKDEKVDTVYALWLIRGSVNYRSSALKTSATVMPGLSLLWYHSARKQLCITELSGSRKADATAFVRVVMATAGRASCSILYRWQLGMPDPFM